MDEPQSWRELLGRVINDPLERQRIANALDVNAITLSRWANGNSNPRPENVRNLLDALPQHHPLLLSLIAEEFPEFSTEALVTDEVPQEIPSACYARVLSTHADIPDSLYFWSVSSQMTLRSASTSSSIGIRTGYVKLGPVFVPRGPRIWCVYHPVSA